MKPVMAFCVSVELLNELSVAVAYIHSVRPFQRIP